MVCGVCAEPFESMAATMQQRVPASGRVHRGQQVSGGRWLIVSAGHSGIRVSVRLDVAYAGGGRGMCCSVQVHVHCVHACSLYGNRPHCIVSLLS